MTAVRRVSFFLLLATGAYARDVEYRLGAVERLARDATLIVKGGKDVEELSVPEEAGLWCFRFSADVVIAGQSPAPRIVGCAAIELEKPTPDAFQGAIVFLRPPFEGYEEPHAVDGKSAYRVVMGGDGVRKEVPVAFVQSFLESRKAGKLREWALSQKNRSDPFVGPSVAYSLTMRLNEGDPAAAKDLIEFARTADRTLSQVALSDVARSRDQGRFDLLASVARDPAAPATLRLDSVTAIGQSQIGLRHLRNLSGEKSPAGGASREYLRDRVLTLPLDDSAFLPEAQKQMTPQEWKTLEDRILSVRPDDQALLAGFLPSLALRDDDEAAGLLARLVAEPDAAIGLRLSALTFMRNLDTRNRKLVLTDAMRASKEPVIDALIEWQLTEIRLEETRRRRDAATRVER